MKIKYKTVAIFADVIENNVASEMILIRGGFVKTSTETITKGDKKYTVDNFIMKI